VIVYIILNHLLMKFFKRADAYVDSNPDH